jgi:hypothetical protein
MFRLIDISLVPLVPAKAGTQSPERKTLDARVRGHERKEP